MFFNSSSLSRNLQVTVPDKNTTWVATAFVMSEGLGLGITDVPIEVISSFLYFLSTFLNQNHVDP